MNISIHVILDESRKFSHGRVKIKEIEIPLDIHCFIARVKFSVDDGIQGWMAYDTGKQAFITSIGDVYNFRQDAEISRLDSDIRSLSSVAGQQMAKAYNLARKSLFFL